MARAVGAALACCLVMVLLAPAQGRTMELGVSDFGIYAHGPHGDDSVMPRAYLAAGYVGASWSREIVERGPFYDGSGSATAFDFSRLDRWVNDVTRNEMRPFLTLTNARQIVGGVDQLTERQRTADSSTFAAWCGQVADRYDGSDPAHPPVNDFSVWNEPNLSQVGDLAPARYREYYAACQSAIKQGNPNAKVYFGEVATGLTRDVTAPGGVIGPCEWLARSTGGATVLTDGVAIHPYQFTIDPTAAMTNTRDCQGIGKIRQWAGYIAAARLVTAGGGAPPLLISEFGYCSERTPAPSGDPYVGAKVASCGEGGTSNVLQPAVHATYIARAWTVASSAGATLLNYHTLAKRNQWQWRSGSGGMWESGILDNPMPFPAVLDTDYSGDSYGASIEALREATGVQDPSATMAVATAIVDGQAVLNGVVNPRGAKTTYHFEYGPTSAYGHSTPSATVPAGTSDVAVSAAVTGLPRNSVQHVRLVVRNRHGDAVSGDATFKSDAMSRPSAVVERGGGIRVFFRGADRQLSEWRWDGGWTRRTWGATGAMAGDPSAVILPSGRVEVFYRGADDLLHRRWIDGERSGLQLNEPVGMIRGDPAATVGATGLVEVFYRYAGNHLRQHTFDVANDRWSALTHEEPGAVTGDPALVVAPGGRLEQFYRYRADYLRRHWLAPGRWNATTNDFPGTVEGDPAAVLMPNGRVEVLYRYAGGKLRRHWFDSAGETGSATTNELFDAVSGPPAAVATSTGRLEVFYRTRGDELRRHWFADPQWGVSDPATAGRVAGEPGAVVAADGTRHAFVGTKSGGWLHYAVTDSGEQLRAIQPAPEVETGDATAVAEDRVTLDGRVAADADAGVTYRFEYGLDTSYGSESSTATVPPGSGMTSATRTVDGLLPATTYHYRIVATGPGGTRRGADRTFRTAPVSRAAVVIDAAGDLRFFTRSATGQLTERYEDGSAWRTRTWGATGAMAGDPSAVALRSGRVEVFYRSTDGFLHRYWFDGSRSGLQPNELQDWIRGDPAAAVGPTGLVEVFYRYAGGKLRQHTFDVANDRWDALTHEEFDAVLGDPAFLVSSTGRLEQFYRYRGDRLRRHWLGGGTFGTAIVDEPGMVVDDPAAVEMASGRVEVLYRYPGGKLRRQWFGAGGDGATTNEEFDAVIGAPAAAATDDGRLEAFYRYRDGDLRRHWFGDPGWGISSPATNGLVAGDPAVVKAADGTRHVFFGRRSGGYFHYEVGANGEQLAVVP